MVAHGIVIRLQFIESAMLDGAFAFVVRNPCTSLSLLESMSAYLHQGFDDIFESIVIVVYQYQTLLIINLFVFQREHGFFFLDHNFSFVLSG